MKFLLPVFLLCLTINLVFGLPARDPKDDAEVVSVPQNEQQGVQTKDYEDADTDPNFKDFKGVVDTGAEYPYYSSFPYFKISPQFFENFEDIFSRLRERFLTNWWSSIPKPGDADWDPSEGNSTSEVKVIDGHKVVVNDTVYTKKDDTGNAIFRVRILNIRPVDSSEETGTSGPSTNTEERDDDKSSGEKGSPELVEKPTKDNEISGNIDSKENSTTTISLHGTETQFLNSNLVKDNLKLPEDVPTISEKEVQTTAAPNKKEEEEVEEDKLEQTTHQDESSVEDVNENETPVTTEMELISETQSKEADGIDDDGDDDSNIKKGLTEKNGDDWENVDERIRDFSTMLHEKLYKSPFTSYKSKASTEIDSSEENHNDEHFTNEYNPELDAFNDNNNEDNNIDAYESVPVDLSNDIAVNQMLADQGAPHDPDAEVFSVEEFIPEFERQPIQRYVKQGYLSQLTDYRPIKK